MVILINLVVLDAIISFFFIIIIAIDVPLLNSQNILPSYIYPTFLKNLHSWYTRFTGDYLFIEKPFFFIGIMWIELLIQWPLAIASLYAIVTAKSWLSITLLIYGVSAFTSVVTTLSDMIGSGRALGKLLALYLPFLGFSVVTLLQPWQWNWGRTKIEHVTEGPEPAFEGVLLMRSCERFRLGNVGRSITLT